MKRGFKADAERKSLELRSTIGLKSYDPVDCLKLSTHLEITTIAISEMTKYGLCENSHEALCGKTKKEFSAILLNINNNNLIIYNHTHSSNRINSSLAHEISHVVCRHDFNSLPSSSIDTLIREFPEEFEDEANWLSGCILLPREGLIWALRNEMSLQEIASHFEISIDMARWRYNSTGVRRQLKIA